MVKVMGATGSYELLASEEAYGRAFSDEQLCHQINRQPTDALVAEAMTRPGIRFSETSEFYTNASVTNGVGQ